MTDRRAVIWQPHELAALAPITGANPVRPVDSIVIHHTCGGTYETAQGIHQEHLHQTFGGIGYHFWIDRDGRSWRGRPLWARGAHCRRNNSGRIGIALSGNYQYDPPSKLMLGVTLGLVDLLRQLYGPLRVYPHRLVPGSNTDCPGTACIEAFAAAGLAWDAPPGL